MSVNRNRGTSCIVPWCGCNPCGQNGLCPDHAMEADMARQEGYTVEYIIASLKTLGYVPPLEHQQTTTFNPEAARRFDANGRKHQGRVS